MTKTKAMAATAASGLTVGQVARHVGVSTDTVRYYERIGVLPKAVRTAGGYRSYPDGVLNRIALVRNAQRFGFSLREIAAFLRVRDRGGKPCHDVRAAAGRMLEAMDQHLAELTAARTRVRQTLDEWDQRLARTPAAVPARLLETLTTDKATPRLSVGSARGTRAGERL